MTAPIGEPFINAGDDHCHTTSFVRGREVCSIEESHNSLDIQLTI